MINSQNVPKSLIGKSRDYLLAFNTNRNRSQEPWYQHREAYLAKSGATPNKVLQLTRYSALFQSADIFTLPKRAEQWTPSVGQKVD